MEEALQDSQPDLLMLDQLLPLKCGTDVLMTLRRNGHTFPVLMLSALHAPSDRIAGLEAGADDYIGKPFVFRELQLRLSRLLAAGHAAVCPAPPDPALSATRYSIGPWRFDVLQRRLALSAGEAVNLSRGDSALLLALCREPGAVVTRQKLAQATGSLVDPEHSRTIDVRLSRLRRLLNQATDGRESLECLRGIGYRLTLDVKGDGPPSPP
jgi:DNA-binding response OmpR family regulator